MQTVKLVSKNEISLALSDSITNMTYLYTNMHWSYIVETEKYAHTHHSLLVSSSGEKYTTLKVFTSSPHTQKTLGWIIFQKVFQMSTASCLSHFNT